MRPYGLFDVAAVSLANSLTIFPYVDSISDKLDFIGINYYGQVYHFSNLKHSWHVYLSLLILSMVRKWSVELD